MKTFYAPDRKTWREWLSKNHDKEKEIWLVYYRKSSGKPTVSYNDSVKGALCFGWIDSIEKGVDEAIQAACDTYGLVRNYPVIEEGQVVPPAPDGRKYFQDWSAGIAAAVVNARNGTPAAQS